MEFTTIQLAIFVVMALVLVAGVIFIIQDSRAHNRRGEEFSSRKKLSNKKAFQREHEPA